MRKRWLDLEEARVRACAVEEQDFMKFQRSWVLLAGEIRRGRLVSGDGSTMMLTGDHSVCSDEERMLPDRGRYCLLRRDTSAQLTDWLHIGRTIENDIVINDYTLSKKHARMRQNRAGTAWELEDCGSTNHSFLEKEQLVKGKKYPVKSGMLMRLGRLNFTVLDPTGFYDFLVTMRE